MNTPITIDYLADHREIVPLLTEWFEQEWEPYYGLNGPGNAEEDLLTCSRRDTIPIALIAMCGGEVCGTVSLKSESIATHPHLTPWVAALLVIPSYRGRGVGTALINQTERLAQSLGFSKIYFGGRRTENTLVANGWNVVEDIDYLVGEGSIYVKTL